MVWKKNVAWGLRPAAWQGRLVTAVLLMVVILSYFRINTASITIFILALIIFILIIILTGQKPGSKQFNK